MDPDQRSAGASSVGSSHERVVYQRFHRAYKACLKCRARKTRCDITAEDFAAGMPCVRCRREMRTCTFPAERQGPIEKSRGTNARRESDARSGSWPSSSTHNQRVEITETTHTEDTCPSPRMSGVPSDKGNAPQPVEGSRGQVFVGGVTESVMRTVVSNGEDALKLLVEAAQHPTDTMSTHGSFVTDGTGPNGTSPMALSTTSPAHSTLHNRPVKSQPAMSANISTNTLNAWKAYRFIKMGWLSAEEAVTYMDLFFQNQAPLSMVVDDFYANHSNHYFLITREPLLCCIILAISSRYHVLPVSGGESRGHMIHHRLWDHCQHLLMRILLGQEKSSKAKTRTLGSIEALLLLTEWQPRALHGPPAADGWDSDAMLTLPDERDGGEPIVDNPSRDRWLEDVISPARSFDRLAWMVTGMAMSLAHELGIFHLDETSIADLEGLGMYERRNYCRRKPLASILCSYQEQLSARLGRESVLPQSVTHGSASFNPTRKTWDKKGEDWTKITAATTDLIKLTRSVSDMLFPSATVTKHLLQSGRYVSMIEHFCSSLSDWEAKHRHATNGKSHFSHILHMEYQYARIYANSLALQAVVERAIADGPNSNHFEPSPTDYDLIQTVVDGCLEILRSATSMHQQNRLRYAPHLIYLRITMASVFLLKGLGLGVSVAKLHDSLHILTQAITALRESRPDDLHLGSRHATLLEMHVARLKENFIPTARPPRLATRPGSEDRQIPGATSEPENSDWPVGLPPADMYYGEMGPAFQDDWMTLPFDPSLQPFATDEMQELLGNTSLDFIWNLCG